MKAYSVDLRQRVADAVLQDHLPWAQVARHWSTHCGFAVGSQ